MLQSDMIKKKYKCAKLILHTILLLNLSKNFCFLPVNPSAFGILVVIVLKILTSTRNTVTSSVILPGTISGGTRKLIHDTITNIPEGR